MTAKRKSLIDFATDNPPLRTGNKPWLETIPEYDEVIAAYKAGVGAYQIVGWLTAPPPDGCGYGRNVATRNRVGRYLNEKVGRDGTSAAR